MNSRFDPEANQWPANIPDEPVFSPLTEFAELQTRLMEQGTISPPANSATSPLATEGGAKAKAAPLRPAVDFTGEAGWRCEVCDGILRGDREIRIGAHARCLEDT